MRSFAPNCRIAFSCVAAFLTFCGVSRADESPLDFFESKIRPLLVEHCYECHSADAGEAGGNLRLDSAAATRRGGGRGAAVVPGNLDESMLIHAVGYSEPGMEMPPTGKLPDEQIQLLRDWIKTGAEDPREEATAEPKAASPLDRDPASHWAFVTPLRPTAPQSVNADARDVVDAFFVAAAKQQNLQPESVADRATLIRRLYFDLAGLVPSITETDEFVADKHPLAYDRLVDKLIAAPEFGERFGRHWMDVARYADTVGYNFAGRERRLIGSERFRDWTIAAFAGDMPYDKMIRHQLSGDRTDPDNAQGNLDAMGFLTVGRLFQNKFDLVDDRIDVITRGLLGMTVACARCHDHKFDPIPTADYYSLAGILLSSEQPEDGSSPLMMRDKAEPSDERIMLRGQSGNRGDVAPRQFLTALRKADEPRFDDGSGRAQLADRITASDNPLTYRVMVNRLWTHLIGQSLVQTPSDFGFRTEPPAVPEVLDELATDFAEHKSIKRMVRRIVTTQTYQRQSTASDAAMQQDPENRFAMRGNLRRRDFESQRDSMLQVAGQLQRVTGGEPVDISVAGAPPRRTVYAFIDRQNLPGLFRTFDIASPDAHTPQRHYTTIPQQSLFMLNSPLVMDTVIHAASSPVVSAGDDRQWVEQVFARVLGRVPSEPELQLATDFLAVALSPSGPMPDPRRQWSYGLATIDPRGFIHQWQPFPVFERDRWQASSTYPDPVFGHAQIAAERGHPGGGLGGAVVRRWSAPADGTVTVVGVMGHNSDQGDGVRATFAIGESVHWQEVQKSSHRPYDAMTWPIKQGQSLDLIVDDNGSPSFDSYFWRTQIRFEGHDGRTIESSSVDDFSGPLADDAARVLSRREQFTHLLMISNEFAFVD